MDSTTGAAPAEEAPITLSTWQDASSIHWSFQHMREIIPSQPIPAAEGRPSPLRRGRRLDLARIALTRLSGTASNAQEVVDETSTDALLVLHRGKVVAEHYYAGCTAATPHLLMSVSKSIVGCVAGILVEQGLLDPKAT